jgi:hypothetical protein
MKNYNQNFKMEQIEQINRDTTDSINRSCKKLQETLNLSINTMAELDKQGNQIKGMEKNMEIIEDNTIRAEKHLNRIKSVFGSIANVFTRNKSVEKDSIQNNFNNSDRPVGTISSKSLDISKTCAQHSDLTGFESVTQNPVGACAEPIQEEGLDELLYTLTTLHAISLDMNTEIDNQNKRLSKLSNNVKNQDKYIQLNSSKIQKLL